MIVFVIGVVVASLLLAWMFGGFVLRILGAALFWMALVSAVFFRTPEALLGMGAGVVLWTLGQAHFKLRWLDYQTPLSYRVLSFVEYLTGRLRRSRG